MGKSLTRKIIESHYVSGSMTPGEEVFIKVDQTLTHDINAVMTYLAFEAIGLDRIRTECSVSYLDHNLLYLDNKTPDDHIYLQSVAKRYGVHVSRPGNGICHAVHVARFGVPGKLSMGGDSHTPHGGSIGMLCIGVGGMDVATAMTGVPMRLKMPQIIKVNLKGHLKPGCNAKEIILEMLRRVGIKGGLGKVFEYVGPGAAGLEVSERATITNMGAEMGATTSIFPGDEQVRRYGINDAPVLARADVGIAMGGIGSDAAVEAADVVIMDDEPSKIVDAICIARKTVGIVKQNIIFAIAVKIAVLILVALGYATMWAAVFGDVGVSVLAILNAIRALSYKK